MPAPQTKPLSIHHRILIAAIAPAVLVALIVSGVLIAGQWQAALDAQERRIAALAGQLATLIEFNLFSGNIGIIERQLQLALNEPDVLAAATLSPAGVPLASTLPMQQLPPLAQAMAGFGKEHFQLQHQSHWHALPVRATQTSETDLFVTAEQPAPLLGYLLLQVSSVKLLEQVKTDALQALAFAAGVLGFGILLALGLARGLIVTLEEIGAVVAAITGRRKFFPVVHVGQDELGRLATGINLMADTVTQTQDDLRRRIAEATQSLREERDAAALAAESRSRFFAAASHDLRQPLQALGLFANRLLRDARHSTLLPRIQQLDASVTSLQQMLDALLDYSRLTGGVFRIERRAVHAVSLIDALLEEFQPAAAEAGLALRQRVPADLWFDTDPALLRRILINLLGNALRYTERGGVLIACRRVALPLAQEAWQTPQTLQMPQTLQTLVRLEVWDSGRGIPDEQQSIIFDELVQLNNPERDPAKGLGLGLAIVRRTADLLCHPLELCSRVGHGTRFRLTLPGADAPPEAPDTMHQADAWLLLLATDDTTTAQIAHWGYPLLLARSEAEALAMIRAHEQGAPALVVCDSGTDLHTGDAWLNAIDAASGRAVAAIVIHSGAAEAPADASARIRLCRPFRPARLRALLDHLWLDAAG